MTDSMNNIPNVPGSHASNEYPNDFGNRVKSVRSQLHLSQKELAVKLKIAGSYLSEIESGKTRPGFDFFYKTSKILNINPLYLLHGSGSIFQEAENSWHYKIDFGSLNPEIKELIWYMNQAPTVAHAILEFFSRYLYNNHDLIDIEINRSREKKQNQNPNESK